ncbi:MAG TPA: hypothetical protein G4N92_08335 [Anaerolineae bacterium]|nr:hypothetical protein [Anaerolineae bacterium]
MVTFIFNPIWHFWILFLILYLIAFFILNNPKRKFPVILLALILLLPIPIIITLGIYGPEITTWINWEDNGESSEGVSTRFYNLEYFDGFDINQNPNLWYLSKSENEYYQSQLSINENALWLDAQIKSSFYTVWRDAPYEIPENYAFEFDATIEGAQSANSYYIAYMFPRTPGVNYYAARFKQNGDIEIVKYACLDEGCSSPSVIYECTEHEPLLERTNKYRIEAFNDKYSLFVNENRVCKDEIIEIFAEGDIGVGIFGGPNSAFEIVFDNFYLYEITESGNAAE